MSDKEAQKASELASAWHAANFHQSDDMGQYMRQELEEAFVSGCLARDAEPTTVTAEELDAEFLKAREEIHAVSQFQPASYLVHVNDANTVIDRLQKRVMNRFRIEGDEA